MKAKPQLLIRSGMLITGAIALAFSIVYTSSILAFIGLGLVFWGAILSYIQSADYVKKALLDATASSAFSALNQMIRKLGYNGEAVYLPPKYLKDPEESRVLIQIPGSSTLDGGGRWPETTVEHWIYLTATQSNTRTIARIPSYEIGITSNKLFASIWVATGSPLMSGHNKISSSTTLQPNTWYHVALTYKSGVGMALYINGVQDVTKLLVTGNIQPSGFNPLYIGWFDYFKGMIDEVNIYPKSLSQQQLYQRYVETRNGLSNSSTILSQETLNGQTWKCEVTPNDSHQDGTTKSSNPITIGSNNKPTAKDLTITPTTPKTNNNLTASYTFFDPDGDPNQSEIRWFKNSVLQPGLNDTMIVPHFLTAKGEVWHFTVRPYDGIEYGETRTSAEVTVQNTSPDITSWYPLTDPTINETQNQIFNVTCSDIDGDILSITWHIYYSNGTLREQATGDSYTFYANLGDADTYTIIVKVSDGQSETVQQWTLVVQQP